MKLTMVIYPEGGGFVALCPEFDIASQGTNTAIARSNLTEAVQAFLASAAPQEVRSRLAGEFYVETLETQEVTGAKTGVVANVPADQFFKQMESLIDSWCEHRMLGPLRIILGVWPMPNGFSDEWHNLRDALRHIRAMLAKSLPESELQIINELIALIDIALLGRR